MLSCAGGDSAVWWQVVSDGAIDTCAMGSLHRHWRCQPFGASCSQAYPHQQEVVAYKFVNKRGILSQQLSCFFLCCSFDVLIKVLGPFACFFFMVNLKRKH